MVYRFVANLSRSPRLSDNNYKIAYSAWSEVRLAPVTRTFLSLLKKLWGLPYGVRFCSPI
jgi:hypothetical protein